MPDPTGRSPVSPPAKPGLHPRNRHAGGYDFQNLLKASPELAPFVSRAKHGGPSIDFADPEAVKALNRALLAEAYGIRGWDLPPGYLCPPIPGRADYVHHLADLLASDADGAIPRGPAIRVLDVGVGASAIYPLIGQREYGWSFVGSEVDGTALASAERILAANPGLTGAITLRRQQDRNAIFTGIVEAGERFELTLCNPPFHGSMHAVREASGQKWRKLGRETPRPLRNFGGQGTELWCEGGEVGFLRRISRRVPVCATRCAGSPHWSPARPPCPPCTAPCARQRPGTSARCPWPRARSRAVSWPGVSWRLEGAVPSGPFQPCWTRRRLLDCPEARRGWPCSCSDASPP